MKMRTKRAIALFTAGLIVALAATTLLTTVSSAIQFSDSNKDIEIVFEEFTGYRFYGPDAPIGEVDTGRIATVKFYIKCPDLETIEEAIVQLVYNSGTTGWQEIPHDLNDGLIVEIDVPGVVSGDFFDAALGTWNEEVQGTFSVEVLDSDGNVIGEGVYTNEVPEEPEVTAPESTEEVGPKEKDGTTEPESTVYEPEVTGEQTTESEPEQPKDGTIAITSYATSAVEPEITTVAYTTYAYTEHTEVVAGAYETEPEITEITTQHEIQTTEEPPIGTTTESVANDLPKTGGNSIITGVIFTGISAAVIVSTRTKKRK
jgi:hypothetical protein